MNNRIERWVAVWNRWNEKRDLLYFVPGCVVIFLSIVCLGVALKYAFEGPPEGALAMLVIFTFFFLLGLVFIVSSKRPSPKEK